MKNSISVDVVSWRIFWTKLATILDFEPFDNDSNFLTSIIGFITLKHIRIWVTEIPMITFRQFLWWPSWKRPFDHVRHEYASDNIFCLKGHVKIYKKLVSESPEGVYVGSFYIPDYSFRVLIMYWSEQFNCISCTHRWVVHHNCTTSRIPQCSRSLSHNAPFRIEMCTFLFWMVSCGIWNRCIVRFVRLICVHKMSNKICRPSNYALFCGTHIPRS